MAQTQPLPAFAPVPDKAVRPHLSKPDWDLLVSTWASLVEHYTARLDVSTPVDPLPSAFLVTLMEELAKGDIPELRSNASVGFLKACFDLISKLLESDPPQELLAWEFLADFSAVYSAKKVMPVLERLFQSTHRQMVDKPLVQLKKTLVQSLDAVPKTDMDSLTVTLVRLRPLLNASSTVSAHMLAGSDFVDGLISAYRTTHPPLRSAILATTYLCITGLTTGSSPSFAMLGDQLFALKAAADTHRAGPLRAEDSLVPELVSTTPVLSKIRSAAEKASALSPTLTTRLDSLVEYRKPGAEADARRKSGKEPKAARSRFAKGKGKALDVDPGFGPELSNYRLTVIAQVQELFPHLGQGFIARLMDEYGEGADLITLHLLENTLPPHLEEADQAESLESYSNLPPPRMESELPIRKNAFDDDELDQLAVDTSRLHFGKTTDSTTADNILNDRSSAPSKASIKAALAAFDSDDDERDDTYDAADVGGAVDTTADDEEVDDAAEEVLYRALQDMPGVFDRTPEARRGTQRAKLRNETGWTDEAIEGWAYMLEQNPQRKRRLDTRYSIQRISQSEIRSTAWRASRDDDTEDGDGSDRGARGGYRGRGRGRGGRGGGGSASGPSGDKETEQARRRKEANKGARANHNRREGHAKKMARGGFSA